MVTCLDLQGARMLDWPGFHTHCAEAFGFPAHYGRNMDAWVDCAEDVVAERGPLVLRLHQAERFLHEAPTQAAALLEALAGVNARSPAPQGFHLALAPQESP